MLKFDAVKPGVMKCPLAQSHNGKGAHTLATLVADYPVGEASGPILQVQPPQRHPAQQFVGIQVGDRPMTLSFGRPGTAPPVDPFGRLTDRISPPHMPSLDRRIVECLYDISCIPGGPRP